MAKADRHPMGSLGAIIYSPGSGAGKLGRRVTIDPTMMQRRLDAVRRALPEIHMNAIMEGNALIAIRVDETARRDTNRFVRGWLMACKDIGPIPVAIPSVKYASRHAAYVAKLKAELRTYQDDLHTLDTQIDAWFSGPGRKRGAGYAKMLNRRAKLIQWSERLKEEIIKAEGEVSIVFFDMERGRRNYSTVRTAIYGGKGRVVTNGVRAIATMHNLEPHTTIVERRDRIMARAMNELRAFGMTRINNRAKDRLVRAWKTG